MVATLAVLMLATGCSPTEETGTDVTGEVARLQTEISALEDELESASEVIGAQRDALEEARVAAAETVDSEPERCCEELARCCGATSDPTDQVVSGEPTIWSPPHSGYQTEAAAITVVIIGPDDDRVTVNGMVADIEDSAGPESTYSLEIPLDEGPNRLDMTIGENDVAWSVIRDSSLVRRYGRVLDPRRESLGIDYGDMDFQPEYGAGDFDPGDVVVEFADVPASARVITTSAYSSMVIITGQKAIADFFLDVSPPTDVWSVLLRDNSIVHLEGPVPLGD